MHRPLVSRNVPISHITLIHISVQVAGVAEPTPYSYINGIGQAFSNIKQVVMATVLPASAFGDGFDGVGGTHHTSSERSRRFCRATGLSSARAKKPSAAAMCS